MHGSASYHLYTKAATSVVQTGAAEQRCQSAWRSSCSSCRAAPSSGNEGASENRGYHNLGSL